MLLKLSNCLEVYTCITLSNIRWVTHRYATYTTVLWERAMRAVHHWVTHGYATYTTVLATQHYLGDT